MPDPYAATLRRPHINGYLSPEQARARPPADDVHAHGPSSDLEHGDLVPLCEEAAARAGQPAPALPDEVLIAGAASPDLVTCQDCREWRHA